MKKILKFTTILAAIALTTVSCLDESTNVENPTPTNPKSVGYLDLSSIDINLSIDTEVMPTVNSTRAVDAANFTVEILNNVTSEVIQSFLYSAKPAEPIEMAVGSYTIRAYSEAVPNADWEHPVYSGSQTFAIAKGANTTLQPIKCTLSNVKVSLGISADLAAMLGDETTTDITIGSNTLTFSKTESRCGYFKATDTKLKLSMVGTFEGKALNMTKEITGIQAGQWRKINVSIEHAAEGNVTFVVTVTTLTTDDEITVDVYNISSLAESVIPDDGNDPNAPVIEWLDHDIDSQFQVTKDMFDADGNCTENFDLQFTTKNGGTVAKFDVEIASTNSEFTTSLNQVGIPEVFDLCTISGTPEIILQGFGFKTRSDVLGKSSLKFSIKPQISMLYKYDGTHNFKFTVTDSNGLKTTKTLSLLVDTASEGDGPKIEWVDHDLSQRYTVTQDLKVAINVTAEPGIKEFWIDIISPNVLTEDILKNDIGLDPSMSLVNPGEKNGKILTSLGFPTGAEVKDKTSLSFDISQFMGAILVLEGDGNIDFKLTVTDNNGGKTVKSIQLVVIK